MAKSLIPLLQDLDNEINRLTSVHQSLYTRIQNLEEENRNLRLELENTRARLRQTEIDAQFLTMSHRLAGSPDTIISTRRRIARLIRTVDKCISMLKEE